MTEFLEGSEKLSVHLPTDNRQSYPYRVEHYELMNGALTIARRREMPRRLARADEFVKPPANSRLTPPFDPSRMQEINRVTREGIGINGPGRSIASISRPCGTLCRRTSVRYLTQIVRYGNINSQEAAC